MTGNGIDDLFDEAKENGEIYKKTKRWLWIRSLCNWLNYSDHLAAAVVITTTFLLLDTVRNGVHLPGECVDLTFLNRIIPGDWYIVDECHFSQMPAEFLYLPFWIFYTVTNGTDGCILAFRYLFVAMRLIYFCCLYDALRKYGFWAVLCAVVFMSYNAFVFFDAE